MVAAHSEKLKNPLNSATKFGAAVSDTDLSKKENCYSHDSTYNQQSLT